jgi:hypothetical protein
MLCNSVLKFTLTLYNCKSKTKFIFVMFLSGHMRNRCLATAIFVKETDDCSDRFSGVTCYLDCGKLVHCCFTSTSKHMEHRRSAVDKVKSWTFLKNESEPVCPAPFQTGCSALFMEEGE